ncbi:MAG TPA: tetratricopeptide repeat protein [Burkholderiales bacterium]|nr:tetratricopeptide repeat protein [Burkholderiales bacterium]
MTFTDRRGMPVSSSQRDAIDACDDAIELFHGYYGNPIEALDRAIAMDPGAVLPRVAKAGILLTTSEKALLPAAAAEIDAAVAHAATANARERGHIAACSAWLNGDWRRAVRAWGDVLLDHPRDTLALQLAHLGDFYLGQSQMLRDRVARVLPYWLDSAPGFGYVLGMHAFGLEECGDYVRAEQTGRHALEVNARDPWAVHAVAHVMEMQGRLPEGIEWLESRAPDWSVDNGFAFHNWWHLALYYLDLGETAKVLDLYDRRIRPGRSQVILEMIDATAMLWRLHLRGVDVGERWKELADAWEPLAADGHYAFNDVHAMMAFVADGREDAARTLLASLRARADQSGGTNAVMTREVGLPVCVALRAFGRGEWDVAIEMLRPVRLVAQRAGGSHAQRDILSLTLIEAALRGGEAKLARALAAERTQVKPTSPFNWRLTARAQAILGEHAGATHAQAWSRTLISASTARIAA